jgi:hypothetical protein
MDVTLSGDLGPAGARRALGCKSSRNLLGAWAFDAGRRGAVAWCEFHQLLSNPFN